MISTHRPSLTLVDKTNNKVSLIDVAVSFDSKAEQKEQEKEKEKKEINSKAYELNSEDYKISQCK